MAPIDNNTKSTEHSVNQQQVFIDAKEKSNSTLSIHTTKKVDSNLFDQMTAETALRPLKRCYWLICNLKITPFVASFIFTCIVITIGILAVYFGLQIQPDETCIPKYQIAMELSSDYNSGTRYIAVGHFNSDQYLDVVVANYGNDNIGVLLGNGNGTFTSQTTYSTGNASFPCSVIVEDFNKDGQLDIAVANFGTNSLGVFLGYGNGTFQFQTTLSTDSSRPQAMAVGDFDNDNHVDIVIANYGTNNIGIMFGVGNRTFTSQITYSTDFDSNPRSIALGDFNNDGLTDIAVANFGTDNIGVFLGVVYRNFTAQNTYSTSLGSRPYSVSTGHFNNDKQLDLIVTNSGTNNLAVFLGYGDGTFHNPTNFSTGNSSVPHSVTVADFNKDGSQDIAVANYGTDNVGVLLGYGNGTFAAQISYPTGLNSGAQYVIVGDFNNDNRTDIAVATSATDNVDVFLNDRSIDFLNPVTYSINALPWSMAVADFNKDGRADIVVANSDDDNVGILLGYGNGTFTSEKTYSTGSGPQSVTVGDLNNDGRLDIILVNSGDNNVGVLLGQGDGTFASEKIYPTGSGPHSVAVGDFNNDGRLDVAVSNSNDDNVSILLGQGDGTFASEKVYPAGPSPQSLAVGDFNDDGGLDIAVANSNADEVTVLLGYGNGTFGNQTTHFTGEGSYPQSVSVGDLNNDNRSDIIIASKSRDFIMLFLTDRSGEFASPIKKWTGERSGPNAVIVGDLNSNNRLDLVVVNSYSKDVSIFRGRGDGTFADRVPYSFDGELSPQLVAIGDLNSNSRPDIIVTFSNTKEIGVLIGYDAGKFNFLIETSTSYGTLPCSLVVGDFNRDNRLDIGVSNYGSNELGVFFGDDDGFFIPDRVYSTGYNSHPRMIVATDLNKDNITDIAVANVDTHNIVVFLGYEDGSFQEQASYSTGSQSEPYFLTVADFNHDSRLDFAVANFRADNIGVLLGYDTTAFTGTIAFQPSQGNSLKYIVIKDFNNDTIPDIVFINGYSDSIGILIGYGDGVFAYPKMCSTDSTMFSMAVGDFNNDTRWDIIVTHESNVGILLGHGNGTFANETTFPITNSSLQSVVVGDFDSDGRLDIVVTNDDGDVGILLGHGDGTFVSEQWYPTDSTVSSMAVADFDNDGRLDIVVTHYDTTNVGILLGYRDGVFASEKTFSTGSGPKSVATGDFNNDGRIDIVVANSNDGNVSVLLGYGNGTFANQMTFSTSSDTANPVFVVVGDFNSDHRLDIAVANKYYNAIVVLLGYGNGAFIIANTFSHIFFYNPWFIALGDLNMDSRLDIAVLDYYRLYAYLGSPHDGYLEVLLYSTGSGSTPRSVGVGNFDSDNQLDIVVANSGTNSIGIFLGLGSGDFEAQTIYSTGDTSQPYSVAVGDFNNDKRSDIAVANYGTGNVGIFLGCGNGTLTSQKTYFTRSLSYPYSIAIHNINNDTQIDIVVAYFGSNSVAILFGVGDGSFVKKTEILVGYGAGPIFVTIANIINDSPPEIAVANYKRGDVQIISKIC